MQTLAGSGVCTTARFLLRAPSALNDAVAKSAPSRCSNPECACQPRERLEIEKRMPRLSSPPALGALLVFSSLCAVELALQLACLVSPRLWMALAPWRASVVDDPRLGLRGSPDFPEHDAWGCRNPRVPETTQIVAIGDSQTYGTSFDCCKA